VTVESEINDQDCEVTTDMIGIFFTILGCQTKKIIKLGLSRGKLILLTRSFLAFKKTHRYIAVPTLVNLFVLRCTTTCCQLGLS
jgi:hypothetical protein